MKNLKNAILICLFSLFSIFVSNLLSMDKDLEKALTLSLLTQTEDTEKKKQLEEQEQIAIAISLSHLARPEEEIKVKEENFHIVTVLPQKGTDCGYHAIKNGNIIYQWLAPEGILKSETKKEIERRLNLQDAENFPLEKWRAIVAKNRKNRPDLGTVAGCNLYDIEISNIIKNELKLSPGTYSIISNINEVANDDSKILTELANTVEKIRLNPNAAHLFILGNMKNTEKNAGHWISVVLKRENGNYEYYVMDSLGNKTASPMAKSLDTLLKKARLDIAKIPALTMLINDAQEACNLFDAKTVLAKLKAVIESPSNPFNNGAFAKENANRTINMLNEIPNFGSTEHKKEAARLLNVLIAKLPALDLAIQEAEQACKNRDAMRALKKLKEVIEAPSKPFTKESFAKDNENITKLMLNGIINLGLDEHKKEARRLLEKLNQQLKK